MFFLFIVFIILIILLYKKFIKIKNVVDSEQNRKYKAIKNEIGSNNEFVKEMKNNVDIITGESTNNLQEMIDTNKSELETNNQFLTINGIQNLNNIFEYNNDVFKIGGSNANIVIDSNINLNVENPVQARVCNDSTECNNHIITLDNVENEWPVTNN